MLCPKWSVAREACRDSTGFAPPRLLADLSGLQRKKKKKQKKKKGKKKIAEAGRQREQRAPRLPRGERGWGQAKRKGGGAPLGWARGRRGGGGHPAEPVRRRGPRGAARSWGESGSRSGALTACFWNDFSYLQPLAHPAVPFLRCCSFHGQQPEQPERLRGVPPLALPGGPVRTA